MTKLCATFFLSFLGFTIVKCKYCAALSAKFISPQQPLRSSEILLKRRRALNNIFRTISSASTFVLASDSAVSANLPKSTGADLSKTGTIETIGPIVKVKFSLLRAKSVLSSTTESSSVPIESVDKVLTLLQTIPYSENEFKRIFDEYSDPVSYKQKFMDQNAFLVYYTQGFDGPNRPKMEESNEIPKQVLQYGARNDAWTAFDDVMVELSFAKSDGTSSCNDIIEPLDRAIAALDNYLSLAPLSDVETATGLIRD